MPPEVALTPAKVEVAVDENLVADIPPPKVEVAVDVELIKGTEMPR